jgi:methylmalonyl-CoA mutase cobalamin-binding domain/chain
VPGCGAALAACMGKDRAAWWRGPESSAVRHFPCLRAVPLAVENAPARARATLGEISWRWRMCSAATARRRRRSGRLWRRLWRRCALGGLKDGVDAIARRKGRRPRMLVAKMGQDGHDRGANLVSSAFGDLGFDVCRARCSRRPPKPPKLAIEADVDVVGASSLAAGHKTLIPELIGICAKPGASDIKVIAGGVIPAQDYPYLRDAGVQAIFGPGDQSAAADTIYRGRGSAAPAGIHPQYAARWWTLSGRPLNDAHSNPRLPRPTRAEIAALFDLPFTDLVFRAAAGAPRASRSGARCSSRPCCRSRPAAAPRIAAIAASRSIRRERAQGVEADGCRAVLAAAARPRRPDRALLHGRGVARAQGSRHGCDRRDGAGVKALGLETCMTLGMLSDDQATARRGGPRLLQPQSRYLARIL